MSEARGLPGDVARGFFNQLQDGNPTIQLLMKAAATVCEIEEAMVFGDVRVHEVVRARWIAFSLAVHKKGISYSRVGSLLHRDHTTVLHGCNKAVRLIETDPEFASRVEKVWDLACAGSRALSEAIAENRRRTQELLEQSHLREMMRRSPISPVRSTQTPSDESGSGTWTRNQLDQMNRLFCAAFVHSSGGMTYEAS